MTAELARTLLLIGLATCAAIVVTLSFFPWVDFAPDPEGILEGPFGRSFSLKGTELSRIQGATTIEETVTQTGEACSCKNDFGDGYMVAVLGLVALAGASAALFLRSGARSLVLVATGAAVVAFAIAGYNAIAIWEGVGRSHEEAVFTNLNGEVRAELYVLTALAGVAAVLGGAVLATTVRPAPEEADPGRNGDSSEMEELSEWV